MKFNWEEKDSYYFVDTENNMMLRQNYAWQPDGDMGKRDAIGRTFRAYFTYGDNRFINGIESCWIRIERTKKLKRFLFGKYFYQGHRYPTFDHPVPMSRDHVAFSIIAFKYAGWSDEKLMEFVSHLRFKISDFAKFTLNLWVWRKAVAGSKLHEFLYCLFQIPTLSISYVWNKLIYKLAGFDEESHQDDWEKIPNGDKDKKIKFYVKLLYPIYALHNVAWQIKVLPNSWGKKLLQKICLKITPKHNYVIKMLLGDYKSFTSGDIDSYQPMRGARWTTILTPEINDRDVEIIKNPSSYNNLDVDYLRKLYGLH